jgi:hypothetical protein
MIHDDQVADHAAGIATPEYFTPFTPHRSCAQNITAPRAAKRTYRHIWSAHEPSIMALAIQQTACRR